MGLISIATAAEPDPELMAKTRPLSEAESMKTFEIQDGYKVELAAGDKFLNEPVHIVWDGNGAMYVAQMETYMQDVHATGEKEPICTVLKLVDKDWDGIYETRTVFAKGLILPRKLLCLDDKLVIGETDTLDLYIYEDTNNDGVSDKKTLFYKGGPRGGNMEHQPQGLLWNIDNTLAATYGECYTYKNGEFKKAKHSAGLGAQWGLTQNETGQIFGAVAGNERGTMHFQQPPIYGGLELKEEKTQEDFYQVWPSDDIPDVQGGPRRIREDNTLNHFTGTAGVEVYRGAISDDINNDLFLAEPVGRLIRRCKIEDRGGMRVLKNAYHQTEFIRSTDPNFRPVNLATGPDGLLYIVDMYRGIIQQGNWTKPGSYLHGVIVKYGLDKNIDRGRIYTVSKGTEQRFGKPNMINESSQQLLKHLSHDNAWWRLNAQKSIIIRKDLSVVPELKNIAKTAQKPLARLHALWTIDGLEQSDLELLKIAVKDVDSRVREAAVRLLEPHIRKDKSLTSLLPISNETDSRVLVQIKNSLRHTGNKELLATFYDTHRDNYYGLAQIEKKDRAIAMAEEKRRKELESMNAAKAKVLDAGLKHYNALCHECHAKDGKGQKAGAITLGAPLKNSPRITGDKDRLIALAMKGLIGPVDGKNYGVMMPLESNNDQYFAEVLSYTRNSWGNKGDLVTAKEVKEVRKQIQNQKTMYTMETLHDAFPLTFKNKKKWKFKTNGKKPDFKSIIDNKNSKKRWSTNEGQKAGHWLSIELDKTKLVNGIIMNHGSSSNDYAPKYKLETSLNGKDWQSAGEFQGTASVSKARFKDTEAKFIRLTILEKKGGYWSIHELDITGKENIQKNVSSL